MVLAIRLPISCGADLTSRPPFVRQKKESAPGKGAFQCIV